MQCLQARAAQCGCLLNSYESDLAELLKTMILSGHGLAWLSESCIARELAEGKLVCADGEQGTLRLEVHLFRAIERHKPELDQL